MSHALDVWAEVTLGTRENTPSPPADTAGVESAVSGVEVTLLQPDGGRQSEATSAHARSVTAKNPVASATQERSRAEGERYVAYNGMPLTQAEWICLFSDPACRWRLVTTITPAVTVVTEWIGVVRGAYSRYGDAPLLPFYSDVCIRDATTADGERVRALAQYSTRQDAEDGHARIVAGIRREGPEYVASLDDAGGAS